MAPSLILHSSSEPVSVFCEPVSVSRFENSGHLKFGARDSGPSRGSPGRYLASIAVSVGRA